MGASRAEIAEWFDEGVRMGMQHMLVICDTWDWNDFPLYVPVGENPRDYDPDERSSASLETTMECYILDPAKRDLQLRGRTRQQRWDERLP